MNGDDILLLEEYIGPHHACEDLTDERIENAKALMLAVNALADEMQFAGIYFPVNPYTGSRVSGRKFGGFRPQSCTEGAPNSAHKEGQAVDLYDPNGDIDRWLMDNQSALERHGLYMEHPDATPKWCHLGTRAPRSGNRVFWP